MLDASTMMLIMRTTIRVDDHLYRQVKEAAARRGHSVGELIEDALREFLRKGDAVNHDVAPLPVFVGTGLLPGVDLDDNVALAELMDNDRGEQAAHAVR